MSIGIPGQNILNMALTIIAKQRVVYYKFDGRSLNTIGQDVTIWQNPKVVLGSLQPVSRQLYITYGLDLQRDYFTFYTSNPILDVARGISGDQIAFNGQRFQVESDNDWYALDGWKGCLCVRIGIDTTDKFLWGFGSSPANTYKNFCGGNFMSDAELSI